MREPDLARRAIAEAVGSALLVAIVVGSGIMAERAFPDSAGIALIVNALATGAGLIALITTFASISGAHFNPIVTLASAASRACAWRDVPGYIAAQVIGSVAGVIVAHVMFGHDLVERATTVRADSALLLSEGVATFGLILVIAGSSRERVAYAVAGYIAAAYWFTPSTAFANPAATCARALTASFAGIRPEDAPAFIGAQLAGGVAAMLFCRWLHHKQ